MYDSISNCFKADKTIFCFDMKELQWESYMDSSVLVQMMNAMMTIKMTIGNVNDTGSTSLHPWRRRREPSRGASEAQQVREGIKTTAFLEKL